MFVVACLEVLGSRPSVNKLMQLIKFWKIEKEEGQDLNELNTFLFENKLCLTSYNPFSNRPDIRKLINQIVVSFTARHFIL